MTPITFTRNGIADVVVNADQIAFLEAAGDDSTRVYFNFAFTTSNSPYFLVVDGTIAANTLRIMGAG